MNRQLLLQLAAALSLTILAIAAAARADTGGIEVSEPFSRASIGAATAGVVYLTLVNHAARPDRLIAASSSIAGRADLHMTARDGDVVTMRRLESVEIPAGEAVAFRPGDAHIMLSGLKAPLREGDRFALTLQFEAAGSITLDVPVKSIAAGAGTAEDGEAHGAH